MQAIDPQSQTIECTCKAEDMPFGRCCKAIEPVAYAVYDRRGGSKSIHWAEQHCPDGDADLYEVVPLYR